MLKAMTEFCFNGIRYRRDDEVIVSWKEAEKLKANRLVYGTIDQVVPSTDRPRNVSAQQRKDNKKAVKRAKRLAAEKNKATGPAAEAAGEAEDDKKTPDADQDNPDDAADEDKAES